MMWRDNFVEGWITTTNLLATIAGGTAAVLLAVLVLGVALLIVGGILAAVFNGTTEAMAKYWERTGHHPKQRWAQIIARGRKRSEE